MSYEKPQARDVISRAPASNEEIKEIVERLTSAHTKSSQGGVACRPIEPPKIEGYGLKMYPKIEGIETRFAAAQSVPKEKVEQTVSRLHKTNTEASSARIDNPRILLYPERTTLMNNTERIVAYQQSGVVSKQQNLQRRERWYN